MSLVLLFIAFGVPNHRSTTLSEMNIIWQNTDFRFGNRQWFGRKVNWALRAPNSRWNKIWWQRTATVLCLHWQWHHESRVSFLSLFRKPKSNSFLFAFQIDSMNFNIVFGLETINMRQIDAEFSMCTPLTLCRSVFSLNPEEMNYKIQMNGFGIPFRNRRRCGEYRMYSQASPPLEWNSDTIALETVNVLRAAFAIQREW